jgi:hypothetical protein
VWPSIGASLTGYDSLGDVLIVVPCKPEDITRWFNRTPTRADFKRVQRLLEGIQPSIESYG